MTGADALGGDEYMRENMDYEIVTSGEPAYPALLKEIKGYPKTLYYRGNFKLLGNRCVAVVGSRTSTMYGKITAETIGAKLSQRGVTVVSGMAIGIDSSAHRGALSRGGNTAAVLGCGIDRCYPPENDCLKRELEQKGLVLSEFPPGTAAERYNFPQRNRIISGLCRMTIVVQARNRSGALITAELAAEQGREVFAVPGNIDSQYNLGNNKLIKEGATPIISIDDVLESLGLRGADEGDAKEALSETEFQVYKLLKNNGEMSIDEVCCHLRKTPAYINPILSVMEMKGFIFSAMGKIFLANQ